MSRCRLTALVLAAAIGIVPLAPPEHVHESHDDDHHAIVHRHAEAHLLGHADHKGPRYDFADHEGPRRNVHDADHEVSRDIERIIHDDDDDAPELILSTAFTIPIIANPVMAPIIDAVVVIEPPASDPLHRAADYVELLIHGPPRAPASPRPPPATSLL